MSDTNTRRTWLPAEARRRLSVHGKVANLDPSTTISSTAATGGAQPASRGTEATDKAAHAKSSELISPNTPFECGHEFSESTVSGHSPTAASPAASQEVNSKPRLTRQDAPAPSVSQGLLGKDSSALFAISLCKF